MSQTGHDLTLCLQQSGFCPDPPFIILNFSQSTRGKTTESPGPSPVPNRFIDTKQFWLRNHAISSWSIGPSAYT
ncbi:MAG TPA: hypothetical protein VN648_23780, partial [Candidatus Methylomirabilis sp.]|nr:hypothetical protein [Candidatus Methylomirabilis sp.]